MRPGLGSLVVPVRQTFYLDPVGNPSIDNRSFMWPKRSLGIVVHVDRSLGTIHDPWITVYVIGQFGHCLLSEVKEP